MQTLSQLRSGSLTGIKKLTLAENLTTFPLEILSLADSLETLDLSNNQLHELPEVLCKLSKLKILFASDNCFTTLPEVLGRCDQLEMVGFKSNQIKHVPSNSLPPKLRWLILTNNKISTLPDSLGERPKLQKLALAGNQLTSLPQTMSALDNLELIRISANQLKRFPEHLLALPKLAWIAFAGNPFIKAQDKTPEIPQLPSSSYKLQKLLGQGASGIISSALWTTPKKEFPEKIAVKVFKGKVTSDGYPKDELDACLKAGHHPNLVRSLASVDEKNCLALIMELIPSHYENLGLPPSLESCTRDTFPKGFSLPISTINKIIQQMTDVFNHLHKNKVCHGDLYAHNTLYDVKNNEDSHILFGDFGAASMYHMLNPELQKKLLQIEQRALNHFIDDLLSICALEDKNTELYKNIKSKTAV